MKTPALTLVGLAAFALVACGPSEAEIQAAKEKTTADSLAALASTERPVAVDVAASRVKWTGTMLNVKRHFGTVTLTDAQLTVKGPLVTGGSFVADLGSINLEDAGEYQYNPEGSDKNTQSMLIGHLKSADFFDVANHPQATFEITRVEGNTAYGNLSIRGNTHEEKVTDINVTDENGTVTATGKLTFDRQKYDVAWGTGAKDFVLNDDIELEISLAGGFAE